MEPIKKEKKQLVTKTLKKIIKSPGEKRKKQKGFVLSIVKTLVLYLEANCLELEGICRVSGNGLQVKDLKKQMENESEEVDLSKIQDKHVVRSSSIREKSAKLAFFKSLLSALPKDNSDLLQVVLKFLYTIHLNSDRNKMTSSNLAIVFAPTLLRPKEESLESMMNDSNAISEVVKFLIEECPQLYEINTTILYKLKSQDLGIKEEKKSVPEQLEEVLRKIENLSQLLAEESRERAIWETYGHTVNTKLQESEETVRLLQDEKESITDLLNELKEQNKQLELKNQQQEEEISNLKEKNAEQNQKQTKTENQINELNLKRNEMENQIKQFRMEQDKFKKEINDKQMELDKLKREQTEKNKESEQIKKELDKIKKEQQDKVKELDQISKDRNDKVKELDQVKREFDQNKRELEQMKRDFDLNKRELDQNKREMDQNKREFDLFKKENQDKSIQLDQLKNTNQEKQKELDTVTLKFTNLQKEKDDINNQLSRVQSELSNISSSSKKNNNNNKELENAQKTIKDFESKVTQLEKDKSNLNEQIEKLQQQQSNSNSNSTTTTTNNNNNNNNKTKFVPGKKPTTEKTPPPPKIDEDDLLSVKKFAFYYMILAIKTDYMVSGKNCNISSSDVLEEILSKKLKVEAWNEFVLKKIKEIN
eukprot:gene6264-7804_t